ncbi:MAG: polysulfide reductase NrfD [Deltaproteobacteria bacterium]|nr:polysulfide reductase NrfD [Deltaproteobacteria bacterium]
MTSRAEILREIKAAEPVTGCGRWTVLSLILILIGGTAFVIGISGTQAERTWQAFLVNYLFWSGLAFGSVLFSAILVITKARWGRPVKRLAEAPAAFLPLAFLLFWVLLPGREKIFPWIHEPLPQKAAWLNTGFLFARDGLSIFLLTILSLALVYFSVRGEKEIYSRKPGTGKENSDPGGKNLSIQTVLAPLVAIVYALVLSLLGFDLVMSLSPHWYSTLFGMYFFTGAFYSALAALIFLSVLSVKAFDLENFIGEKQFHDLGKLLLGFCLVTGDFFFSQFLVIWYGNLPEETRFVITRVNSLPWKPLAWTVLVLCFALPFGVLLSRKAKMKQDLMLILSGIILIGMWLERFLLVAPSLWKGKELPLGLSELLISLGFLGLMGFSILWFLGRFPLLPVSDPLFEKTKESARGEGK